VWKYYYFIVDNYLVQLRKINIKLISKSEGINLLADFEDFGNC